MSVLFKDVRLLDFNAAAGMSDSRDLRVVNGTIEQIETTLSPHQGERVIWGHGNLLMPGLVNSHFHSSVNHMKGRLPSLPLEIFMLYESPALELLRPTPREAYLRTLLGCIEMLKTGTTAVQDDCFFVPEPDHEIIDAVAQAYLDSGMRVRLALDQPELNELDKLPFLKDILPQNLRTELAAQAGSSARDLQQFYNHLIARWHGTGDGRVKAAVSCSAPQRVSKDYLAALDQLSKAHDLPFYAHMLETRLQRVFGEVCWGGQSLVRYTDDLGALSDRMNIIHAVWVDERDMELLAAAGTCVAHNPISNLRLGSGVMPWRRLHDLNIPVCLGVDEAIASDAINMWAVMKTAGSIHNLTDWNYANWPSAVEVLRAATQTGGLAMREPRLGTLTLGAPADLILIDLHALPFVPLNNLFRQLVYCELGQSVTLSMVAGEIAYEEGQLKTVDEAAILREAAEIFQKKARDMAAADAAAVRLLPHYREMYNRAGAYELKMKRRIGDEDFHMAP